MTLAPWHVDMWVKQLKGLTGGMSASTADGHINQKHMLSSDMKWLIRFALERSNVHKRGRLV